MATDVDVQYFSHLNGLVLGNNWGDLIRLLDKTLVTGIAFTEITAASIDAQGEVHITLYSAHNALLFQIVELSGFTPNSLNQKYRIKGTPSATELVLKPSTAIDERSVATKGTGKLASLGYEIVFRDQNDVKRVYRAKNPRAEHPFIRVDESLTSPDGTTGVYTSSYAKYAMVGLLENMTHIDDYNNPEVLQLPFDPTDPAKNWRILGSNGNVVRGWSKWHWRRNNSYMGASSESSNTPTGNSNFTLVGDADCFYLNLSVTPDSAEKSLRGCGLFRSTLDTSIIPNWVLLSLTWDATADSSIYIANGNSPIGVTPLMTNNDCAKFQALRHDQNEQLKSSIWASPILPDLNSGTGLFSGATPAALEIPFLDEFSILRGTLMHVCYLGDRIKILNTLPILSEKSMYVSDSQDIFRSVGGLCFYLGELE